jgi:hypothetical protein
MSKRRLAYDLLAQAGTRGVTTAEFLEAGCGSRFGARIQELRAAGATIDVRRLRTGSHLYTLRRAREPRPVPADVDAVELSLFELPPRRADYRDAA